ncbi:hypothetical protein [Sediminicoccus rosea]|jgi:hypothetical protein|uniref:DUF2135 domain-containing protein n=1 Tax=Sediminicoccus rosea TaxID=1225128 RepID=A0ABZ0PI63_9PROT|nr:hypothetical protein [Sediminicoccus rosea]WPB85413.1 hypothetical protein R9Z33_00740 [Sediminicoccus rosea]
MEASLIATTRNADLRPLATGGQVATEVWQQIAGHLRQSLSPAHAALLAEPQPAPDRGLTDWYSSAQGPALVLEEMAEPAREAARNALSRLVQDVNGEIAKLRASRRDADKLLAELLALALITPSADSVRVIGGQPVLVAWGHAAVNAAPAPELLLGQLSRPPGTLGSGNMEIVGPPPAEPPRQPWAAIGALLLALLLLLLALLLLWRDPFGWFHAPPQQCVVAPGDLELAERLRAEQEREGRLRQEILQEMQRLAARRLACPPVVRAPEPPRPAVPAPVPAPATPPAAPPPQPPNQDAERAREEGARTGRIQVILAWDDVNDLDLSILCPAGQARIYFGQTTACGGTLDVDRNAGGAPTPRPVENIVFSQDPPPGTYTIVVTHYATHAGGPRVSPWRVTLRREGRPEQRFSGQVATGQSVTVTTFTVP